MGRQKNLDRGIPSRHNGPVSSHRQGKHRQEGETIADALVEGMFTRFRTAEVIHSNQGRNFESGVFTTMCEHLSMQKTQTTPLHSRSDGLVKLVEQNSGKTTRHPHCRTPAWLEHAPPSYLICLQVSRAGFHLMHTCPSHVAVRAMDASRNGFWQLVFVRCAVCFYLSLSGVI